MGATLPLLLLTLVAHTQALPDQGRWDITLTDENHRVSIAKSLFKESQIFIQAVCNPHQTPTNVTLQWTLTQSICWKDIYHQCDNSYSPDAVPLRALQVNGIANFTKGHIQSLPIHATCSHGEQIIIPEIFINPEEGSKNPVINNGANGDTPPHPKTAVDHPVFTVPKDGVYLLTVEIIHRDYPFNISLTIKMRGTYGYLSAVDWPFLPFYATMCGVYVCLGTAWLIVCWLQWRDILRIQFWIGAVVLLGMLEKAMFYAEYSSINSSGVSVKGAVLAAEWVSVAKRTLARMLVVIVSLGFGIVKPRLGPMLQRVVGLGILWGALAALEAWLRIGGRVPIDGSKEGSKSGDTLLAAAPLALLDAALCWWVFASLLHTTRTLRLRRNMVKLSLYKHFTNTLIFAVLSSIVFMLYSIKEHCLAECLTNWKELWIDDGYWHILFSVVLLIIMILWRPTNNNQRYAFTPLLDNPDDDDEEEEHFVSDAYGVKIRGFNRSNSSGNGSTPLLPSASSANSNNPPLTPAQREEADLKWVEDNIPATALPILDSDEEILNAKFEISKMQ